MDLKLKGKNALITGSSRGIGYAIATLLHKEGCNVTINGRNDETLKKTFCHSSKFSSPGFTEVPLPTLHTIISIDPHLLMVSLIKV